MEEFASYMAVVVLLGSTGTGKSTLGNFLLDPSEEHIVGNPTFPTAKSNTPETKQAVVGSNDGITVIDTPGLNEGETEDREHMKDVVETLKKQQSISACILCVKFDSKIDKQFEDTVKYYKRTFPWLFENNVFVVITNYCTDILAAYKRKRLGIDQNTIATNFQAKISEGLTYKPDYYLIDGLPYGPKPRVEHEKIRSCILDRIKKMSPVQMKTSPMTVVLIGSTGNGKSTLGNFLLDPSEEHTLDDPTFPVGKTNKPETKYVTVKSMDGLTIVDTPGLNEGQCEDLERMIALVKQLNELQSISACILCVKFDSKIDKQYKSTVEYYKRLLPQLFENNVLVVFTNYCTDERSRYYRMRRNIDEDAIVKNALCEVSKGLVYQPGYFLIDAMPFDEQSRLEHEETRWCILDCITEQLESVNFHKSLKVAKTAAVKKINEQEIEKAKGEIIGYKEAIRSANSGMKDPFHQIQTDKLYLLSIDERISSLNAKLRCLDSDDLETSLVWSLDEKWKWFKTQFKEFEVASEWPIADYSWWDNGKVTEDLNKKAYSISVKVKGRFMCGLHAMLTIKVEKQHKYKAEIERIRKELLSLKQDATTTSNRLANQKKAHQSLAAEIAKYERYITEREAAIKKAEKT